MCGCEGFYVCPRCAGTPADPLYVDLEPRDDIERARDLEPLEEVSDAARG